MLFAVLYYYIDTFPIKLKRRSRKEQIIKFIKASIKSDPSAKHTVSHFLRKFAALILFFLSCMLFVVKPIVLKELNNKNHIRYRAEVIAKDSKSISQLSGETNFKSYAFRALTQQYQNKWFIEHFINRSYSQVDKDFTLQEHFKNGSDYTIQTRDTIIPRYIIGEHNRFIPFVFALIMLLIIVFNFIVFPHSIYTSSGKLITLALSILFAMMLFVTLTSTNLIPFFGQDFPILPTTSKVALGLPLLILLFCLYIHVSKTTEIVERLSLNFKTGGVLVGIILVFVAPMVLQLNKKSIEKDYSLLKKDEIETLRAEVEVYNNEIDSFYHYRTNVSDNDVINFHREYTQFLSQQVDTSLIFTNAF
ncbi:MAG: hypothetical protein IPF62_10970 [Bacteroidetes bacterium]|nr:hypothetical protein [Bacteroidota bacterium]